MQRMEVEKKMIQIFGNMHYWIKRLLIVAIIILAAGAGYYWCHQITLSRLPLMLNGVQASSAFNRIVDDSYLVDLLKRNCTEDALKIIEWNLEQQKRIFADIVQEGVGQDFVKYFEDREPGLIESTKAGPYRLQRDFEIQCPPRPK